MVNILSANVSEHNDLCLIVETFRGSSQVFTE